jgi:hypothetical protein
MSPRTWWAIFLVTIVPVVVVAAAALTVLLLTIDVTNDATARIELVKTGLAVGAGAAGLAALALASRRQWSTEQTARATEHDATERRITELYTKAAEQLGSDKAPVRLAGLYALERLAQDNPAQRQTIVNVLCAYLRMPYRLPGLPPVDDTDETTSTVYWQRVQEREVRLTAQRLLTDHLKPGAPQSPADTFWQNITLDLTGASLIDLDFSGCVVFEGAFVAATFTGEVDFGGATFTGEVDFRGATFGPSRFAGATFTGPAYFATATFTGYADFARATFAGATIAGDAGFEGARFARGTSEELTRFLPSLEGGDETG